MKKEMLELAEWAVQTARTAGADHCRAGINGRREVTISYRERKPETIKEAATRTLNIELFVDGRFSAQSTSDLRRDPLKQFISQAVATTRLLAEDPHRSLPDPRFYAGPGGADLDQVDPAYERLTAEARHATARELEDSCRQAGGPKLISATAMVFDGRFETAVIASNGFQGYQEQTFFQNYAQLSVQDEGDRRPMGGYGMGALRRGSLPAPAAIGREAARRTLDLLGGRKIKTETLPVIIENRVVARLLGGFLAGLYGANVQQKRSFLADKKGQKVASELLTLIDDPFVPGGLGSRHFDEDGLASRRRVMVEAGVVKEFWIDWYYSRKLGCEPTSGGPSNLILPPGKRSVAEIMKDLGRGILITDFIGGNSNSTTGDASIGINGKLFENGAPVQSVAEMNIADNHLKFWQRLAEAANDPWPYSSQRMPSLVFTDVVVSGL